MPYKIIIYHPCLAARRNGNGLDVETGVHPIRSRCYFGGHLLGPPPKIPRLLDRDVLAQLAALIPVPVSAHVFVPHPAVELLGFELGHGVRSRRLFSCLALLPSNQGCEGKFLVAVVLDLESDVGVSWAIRYRNPIRSTHTLPVLSRDLAVDVKPEEQRRFAGVDDLAVT